MSELTDENLNHLSASWALKRWQMNPHRIWQVSLKALQSIHMLFLQSDSRIQWIFWISILTREWGKGYSDTFSEDLHPSSPWQKAYSHTSIRERTSKSFSQYKNPCSKYSSTEFIIAGIEHQPDIFSLIFNSLSLLQDHSNFLPVHI